MVNGRSAFPADCLLVFLLQCGGCLVFQASGMRVRSPSSTVNLHYTPQCALLATRLQSLVIVGALAPERNGMWYERVKRTFRLCSSAPADRVECPTGRLNFRTNFIKLLFSFIFPSFAPTWFPGILTPNFPGFSHRPCDALSAVDSRCHQQAAKFKVTGEKRKKFGFKTQKVDFPTTHKLKVSLNHCESKVTHVIILKDG